ncbi:uncharacterized protein LOC108274794 isoform X7 [Ictalurus punctatus]|uniref:Uncharacterized protein LOC108274794 isoform X7 n=1 Tax=Ictalurus punctatus TaxID=7998 RepID=A0A9F7RQS1_ICTPU|nr:uncharacterized protein LOC108274794 isoform X7 [Ictalurus punctatus]
MMKMFTRSSRHYRGIMTSFYSICIVLGTVCVNPLSAVPEFTVSGHVGSTAVLPCKMKSEVNGTLYIKWEIGSETVFERVGEETYQGEGYEGRVDVPEEELRKGNCALVLRNLTPTDAALYWNAKIVNRTKGSVETETVEISRVNLSVEDPLSAVSEFTVSGHVGSTAVLPCELQTEVNGPPYIKWSIESVTVFERHGEETYQGEGYEGRVDVPEEEPRKGNCSLVLCNLTPTDAALYWSAKIVSRTKGSVETETVEISRVHLSVEVPEFTVSGHVGSTAVLPCALQTEFTGTPHIIWEIKSETVFERRGEETYQGEGYEGRVDVPEEELRKGNCSLVLRNLKPTDAALYWSAKIVSRTKRSVETETVEISRVYLSVEDPLSAVPEFTVSGHVGSTAVLPCELQTEVTGTPHIIWKIKSETVFERLGEEIYQGEGYEGRVDVPEEELRKGNCALVLHNLTPTDAADYRSAKIVSRTKGSVETETIKISRVYLSVEVPEFTVSGHVGSTAVLPCELQTEVTGTPYIKWSIESETVVERRGEETYQGEGYEGRVDVPEEELRKGNCSLVLRNLTPTDAADYRSTKIVSRTKGSVETETVVISRVHLSVEVPEFTVSGHVGSTAVLPCKLQTEVTETPYIKWEIGSVTVFEGDGAKTYQGEGYEGRVDVSGEELRKGNCSLVLRNLIPTDAAVYRSYQIVSRTKGSVEIKPVEISRVHLSVEVPEFTVSGHVGSTAVLPCELQTEVTGTPYIKWSIESETVFERSSEKTNQSEGYEGRADVPVEELRKGNCALVLRNLTTTDAGVYRSYKAMSRTKGSTETETVEISRVHLSVEVPEFTVSGHVGSTAVLPCELQREVTGTPNITWEIVNETVFERRGEDTHQGKGYEGRVDVPEEELRKGNCALVLRNLTPTDAALYWSYKIVSRTKGSVEAERVGISRVHLSVEESELPVSGHVGSTAVLPCKLQTEDTEKPHIIWQIKSVTVFERRGEETYQGEGYEGRVDVPEEELRKGNCSLVLCNLKLTDAAVYRSAKTVSRTKRSVETETVEIGHVYLSVDEKQKEEREAEKEVPRGVGVGVTGTIAVIGVIGVIVAVLYSKRRRKQNRRHPDPPHTYSLPNTQINPANTSQDENPNDQGEDLQNTSPDDHGSVVFKDGAVRYIPVRTDPE